MKSLVQFTKESNLNIENYRHWAKLPFPYHLFYHILCATFRFLLRRVNITRVALTVLSHVAFANLESLCIFLTVHNKEFFNKFVATTHDINNQINIFFFMYSFRLNMKTQKKSLFHRYKMNNFAITFSPISVADLLPLKVTNLEI